MSFFNRIIRFLQFILPSPFSIAIVLTFVTILLTLFLTEPINQDQLHIIQILSFWEKGFWELLAFAMQMMLVLVLGHALALTSLVEKFIKLITVQCTSTAKSALIVSFFTIIISFLNWGLGLIFGAILARKVGEHAIRNNIKLNYPLIGAAGYSGMMVWHGGFSGSAPLKVAESAHFLVNEIGTIPVSETILSSMNISISIGVIILIPISFLIFGKRKTDSKLALKDIYQKEIHTNETLNGAEKLDNSSWFIKIFAAFIITAALFKIFFNNNEPILNLNYINFLLFGLGLMLHKNLIKYQQAIGEAVKGAAGIMIQFPLYAGIMGIMKYSGLTGVFTDYFVSVSNSTTFPVFTFFSAGLVNIFVPSGGGQWAVQGPVLVEAAKQLSVSIPKTIMALAYGDQITNMLQPFWALPLLGITRLKAKDIFPYTFLILIVGSIIYISGLILL